MIRNRILVSDVSLLNKADIDNLLDIPAISDSGFAVNYNQNKIWRVITLQEKIIVVKEFAGSWIEPDVSVSDTAHFYVMF